MKQVGDGKRLTPFVYAPRSLPRIFFATPAYSQLTTITRLESYIGVLAATVNSDSNQIQ